MEARRHRSIRMASPPLTVFRKKQILESKLEGLMTRDVHVLERIDALRETVKSQMHVLGTSQIRNDERVLLQQHQYLTDQIHDIESELSMFGLSDQGEMRSRCHPQGTERLAPHYNAGMFCSGPEESFSQKEFATARKIIERGDNKTMEPVDWLKMHLKQQLNLIGEDAAKELCRIYQLNHKKNNFRTIPADYIHRAWLNNDGMRDETATECVTFLQNMVEEFCDDHRFIKGNAAALLLFQNGFDLSNVNWQLLRQAVGEDVEEIEQWLRDFLNGSVNNIEVAISKIEKGSLMTCDKKEKIRWLLMATRGMNWAAVDSFLYLRFNENYKPVDCLEAVDSSGGNLIRAKAFFKECCICYQTLFRSQLIENHFCQCFLCGECFSQHFSILAKTQYCIYKFVCPACDEPKLEFCSEEDFIGYFSNLEQLLQKHMQEADYTLFQQKLLTWNLKKENNFRWCANGCTNGFISDRNVKKIQCTNCLKYQCFYCNKPWLDQHKHTTCEEVENWKKNSYPEFQAPGLAALLKKNGINCPRCKMRYELAKGGCMHFKCPQCLHEFCCGCNLPFVKYPNCRFPACQGKGLHAHHPRDCLYHLRDQDCETLQKLLLTYGVDINRTGTVNLEQVNECPVKEQRESPDGLIDESCGKPIKNETGLCESHYKEYLVSLINQNVIDPADILTVDELLAALRRDGVEVSGKRLDETDYEYQTRLRQLIKQKIPLYF
ncbi:E3 ubiquitin-protein ligase RNF31-like isoform X2 [Apostichopus japonicus]|uniref:E3 ubiquitin-protein ligase RNF31-like isoform X2 n=1 Tax=Stichopus japonicus TaxID=307972 RepID=UPI003AB4B30B